VKQTARRLHIPRDMRIRDIMTTPVETIAPIATAAEAQERMRAGRFRHLVVVEGSAIVGVISERDLRGDGSVRELMARTPVTVGQDLHVKDAANLMRGHTIGCLPVVSDEAKLVGIVTVTDLLEAIGKATERPVERGKRWTLRHRGPRHHA
jgi:CBS domain-containing protein